MDFKELIEKYYSENIKARRVLIDHGRVVAKKALEIARRSEHLSPDKKFIEEASFLHDIGIFMVNAPDIGCYGEKPYICHGFLGKGILEKEGFVRHAMVCERHIGVGITAKEIEKKELPLPKRDMVPLSVEEEIVCLADKFFSKNNPLREKSLSEIKEECLEHGKEKVEVLEKWVKKYGINN